MTTSDPEPVRRPRGRPRAPGVEDKILHAALDEYTEHGWAGFTMDAVARRAGVGKSTIYLRWHDKDALLSEAVRIRAETMDAGDTGSLEGDLTALATSVFDTSTSPEGWANFRVVMDAASATERLGHFTEEVGTIHRDLITTIVERAVARGETPRPADPTMITDLIYGAAVFFALGRRLEHREPTPEETRARVGEVVSVVLDGLRS